MSLGNLLLIFLALRGSTQTLDNSLSAPIIPRDEDHFDLLESWNFTRVKRVDEMGEKLPDHSNVVCDTLYMTDEAPFTAIILYKDSGRLLCMGSIIDNKNILSAKRCYDRPDVNDLLVLVGYYKAYWGEHSQVVKVKDVTRHEYGVAILKLRSKIRYTSFIQSVRLPTSITNRHDFNSTFPPPYQVVGFFVDRYDVPGDFIGKDKVYTVKEDSYVPLYECQRDYSKSVLHTTKLFCVGGNATYCWGGLGAPVLKYTNNFFVQVGVVIADNCTTDKTGPLLVARTDAYADWIQGNSQKGRNPK